MSDCTLQPVNTPKSDHHVTSFPFRMRNLFIMPEHVQTLLRSQTYLWGRDDAECVHDPVRILFTDLRDEQRAHSGSSSSAQRVSQLEALQTVTALRLFPNHVEYGVNQFGALRVVAFRPVVTCKQHINSGDSQGLYGSEL